MRATSFLLILAVVVFSSGCQTTEPSKTPAMAATAPGTAPAMTHEQAVLPLPSCYMSVEELASKDAGVLVATLASVGGPGDPGPPGAADYLSRWKVIKVVHGQYAAEEEMSFRVQSIPEEHRQRMPEVGKTYILMTYDINKNQIAWMFDYTDRKLREIEAIMKRARPREKD